MTEPEGRKAIRLEGVLFDYGETLVRFTRPDAALAAALLRIGAALIAAGKEPPPLSTLRSQVIDRVEHEVLDHQRRGELTEISVVDASRRAYADAGLDLDDELLDEVLRIEQEAWWRGANVDPAAVPVLDGLRAKGIRVGLCSNAPYRIRSLHEQLAYVGLDSHLELGDLLGRGRLAQTVAAHLLGGAARTRHRRVHHRDGRRQRGARHRRRTCVGNARGAPAQGRRRPFQHR